MAEGSNKLQAYVDKISRAVEKTKKAKTPLAKVSKMRKAKTVAKPAFLASAQRPLSREERRLNAVAKQVSYQLAQLASGRSVVSMG